tara:strand:+ start:1745 stop:4420 length:2676 start_codon:yes stop_codon:yes gene_type:complete
MNFQTFTYIFVLFILLTPNFIFYFHKQYNLLYAFIFCLLFYITFDLVNQTKENMQTSTIKIENVDNAVGVLKKLFGYNQDQNLQINNDLGSGLETVSLENNENKVEKEENKNSINLSQDTTRGEEIAIKAGKSYEEAYQKQIENPFALNNETNDYPFKKLDGCMAHFEDEFACCGQVDAKVSIERTCPKPKPICVNFLKDVNWGTCIENGGGLDNKVEVLGKYYIPPWNINDQWIDQEAKWIWFTKNANKVSTPNSSAVFQYLYYLDNEDELPCNLYIASGCYCYIEIRNTLDLSYNNEILELPNAKNNSGSKLQVRLTKGINHFYFHCYNYGFENSSSGLLVSLLSQDNKSVLFRSDSSWTWYQSFPLLDSIQFNQSDSYLPLLALYNPEHKSFLKMNKDGTLELFYSEKKKLQNTLESNGTIFKVFKNEGKDGTPTTISLYNCAAERFLQMTDNTAQGSIINRGQSIVKENIQWIPSKITDKLISLNSYPSYPAKKYITIQDKITIIGGNTQGTSAQWEVICLDIIPVGKRNTVNDVPSTIGHVYNSPINIQENVNDTFSTFLNTTHLYENLYHKLTIFRLDASYYANWKQNLLLPAVSEFYFDKVSPSFKVITGGSSQKLRNILLYKNLIIGIGINNDIYSSFLYLKDQNIKFIKIQNSSVIGSNKSGGFVGNISVGIFNNEHVLYGIGPLKNTSSSNQYGGIYYRKLKEINDPASKWSLYSSEKDQFPLTNFKQIHYCEKNKQLYSLINNDIYDFSMKNGMFTTRNLNAVKCKYFVIHTLKYKGSYIIGINENFHIFKQYLELETNSVGSSNVIANNLPVSKIVIANDIIFALGKNDGKIYNIPLYGGLLKEYNNQLQGNLLDIYVYNDKLYVLDSSNNIKSSSITQ